MKTCIEASDTEARLDALEKAADAASAPTLRRVVRDYTRDYMRDERDYIERQHGEAEALARGEPRSVQRYDAGLSAEA